MRRMIQGCKFFIASCIPGCGQMYMGYMKRGISLTLLFSGTLALAIFLEMGALAVLLVPVWLYAFFDGYNLRRRLEGAEPEKGVPENGAEPDTYLFGLLDLDSQRLKELLEKRHSLIGWLLVMLGAFALYQELVERIFGSFFSGLYYFMRWEVPRMAVTVCVIMLGIWFIRGPGKPEPDEAAAFVPPVIPVEPVPGLFAEQEKTEETEEAEYDGQ